MQLPGIITVTPEDEQLIHRLASMMGESFLEEPWTQVLLSAVAMDHDQRLVFTRAIFESLLAVGVHHARVYALPDASACAVAYLDSEQGGLDNAYFEELAFKNIDTNRVSPDSLKRIEDQIQRMSKVSDFTWEQEEAAGSDFIHLVDLGVDAKARGKGALRRLLEPFFDRADELGIPCYLETFGDDLEQMYTHLGFTTVRVIDDPGIPLRERCMVRLPKRQQV